MLLTRLIPAVLFALCPLAVGAQPLTTSFRSSGVDLPAFLQRPSEGELRAVVINLQGNPGGRIRPELPLASLLAKHGVASFWFNYSGIWGNSGKYTFSNSVADLEAAVDYLRSPEAKARFDLRDAPIVVFGYSMGSAVALVGAGGDDRVAGIVALAPCDHGYFGRELANPKTHLKPFFEAAADGIFGQNGAVPDGWPVFSTDLIANHAKVDFLRNAPALQDKALLIFGALDDETCPLEDHFFPLYRTLQGAKHPRLQAQVLTSGHGLDEPTALSMRQVTADWIVRSFPGGVVKAAEEIPSEPSIPQPR
jgi:pimeloyl-ACP methyl ester carboxylesterase